MNKDNKSFAETINIIPINEIKINRENSGLFNEFSFLRDDVKKYNTNPAAINIIDFKNEPKESIIKKPSKISSKTKISLITKNCVRKN